MGNNVRNGIRPVFAILLAFSIAGCVWQSDRTGVLNTAYRIEQQEVTLVNGRAELQTPAGSAAGSTVKVVNSPAWGDLDGDGRHDAALFLFYDSGGSGTFYYVAAAVAQNDRWHGSNAVFLGDRIFPRKIRISSGRIIAEYSDRSPGLPMAVPPSIGRTLILKYKEGRLEALGSSGTDRKEK